MTRLPRLSGSEVIRILEKKGFSVVRVRGSHHFLKHSDGRCASVPVHGRDPVGPGLLTKILRDTDLTPDEINDIV